MATQDKKYLVDVTENLHTILLHETLSERDVRVIKELFKLYLQPSHITHKLVRYCKYDIGWDSRAKEIMCTYKAHFGKGFKENDTRNSWVRDENHYVTRTIAALLKGATSPLQIYGQKITYVPIKFRYKKDTATLILYK